MVTVLVTDDVHKALDAQKPGLALYVGGMGAREKNFHKDNMIERGYPEAAEAIERLRTVSLHIDETPGLTPSELRANARRLARQCGKLGLIVVDYLQLIEESRAA